MTYEGAMYYKLLLEADITDPLDDELDRLLEIEDPLSDIVLELTTCNSDRERQISILGEYISKAEPDSIDSSVVADMIIAFFRDMHEKDPDDIDNITKLMEKVATHSDKPQEEPWYSLNVMNELYCFGTRENFEKMFRDLLYHKIYLTTQEPDKPKEKNFVMKLRNVIANEKKYSHPLQSFINYRLTPIYLISMFVILTVGFVLMSIDDEKYTAAFICLLGAFVLLSIGYVTYSMYLHKRIKNDETDRFDFDASKIKPKDVWDFSGEDYQLTFNKYGMTVDGELYNYNHLMKYVNTANPLKRVVIDIVFALDEEHWISLPLNAELLKMLECLNIYLSNQEVLDYIVNNKEEALRQIMNYGQVKMKRPLR